MCLMPSIDIIDNRTMDTRLLEHFVAVADEGNVTRAAERLYAAQSTVSAGLQSLERELGGKLFDRDSRRLTITALGATLLPEARQVLAHVERMRDLATSRDEKLRGRVRVGIFSSMEIVDFPAVLRGFRDRHPLVDVQLTTSPTGTSGLANDLRAGRLDLAFTGLAHPPAWMRVLPLREYPFRVFVHPEHALALVPPERRRPVRLADLVDEPFVDTAPGFANRTILDEVLATLGVRRRIVAEMNDLPAVVRFAGAGLGIAVAPDFGEPLTTAVMLELADDVSPLRIGLALRGDTEPNRATAILARDIAASV
jgi:DNA-binding transcriptional LysR family regulator